MSHWFDEPPARRDVVTVPRLWVTVALSILIHVAVLFIWLPRTQLLAPGDQEQDQTSDRLQVRLAAPSMPPPPPASPPQIQEIPRPAIKPPRPMMRTPPPMVALPKSEAPVLPPPPPPVAPAIAAPQTRPPLEGDLAAYIAARRRERGEQEAAPIDDEKAQFDRRIAANIPPPAHGAAAQETKKGGGIFEIKRMTYDDAAFAFFGWNNSMGRKTPQLIEVRKGNNSDMRIAVVRKMIAIIREFAKEDFDWESPRRSRIVVLSARLSDNAALESFMMQEFFDDAQVP